MVATVTGKVDIHIHVFMPLCVSYSSHPPPPPLSLVLFLQLYGLDSNTGDIVWQMFIPNIAPLNDGTFTLHLLRSTSHPPLPPLCILIGVSMVTL